MQFCYQNLIRYLLAPRCPFFVFLCHPNAAIPFLYPSFHQISDMRLLMNSYMTIMAASYNILEVRIVHCKCGKRSEACASTHLKAVWGGQCAWCYPAFLLAIRTDDARLLSFLTAALLKSRSVLDGGLLRLLGDSIISRVRRSALAHIAAVSADTCNRLASAAAVFIYSDVRCNIKRGPTFRVCLGKFSFNFTGCLSG